MAMNRVPVVRAAEAATVPILAAQSALATTEHASDWTRGTINPPSVVVEAVQDNTPDVMLGALAGTGASLLGSKAVELAVRLAGWLSAPRRVEVRNKRVEAMRNSKISQGVPVLIGAVAGAGSGYGRGAAAMISGGLGGTGSGLLVARRSNRLR